MKVELKPLRERFDRELELIATKYPGQAKLVATLHEKIAPRLVHESIDLETIAEVSGAIMQLAEELDVDGYVYAELVDLTNALDSDARQQLLEGVLRFRDVKVALSLETDNVGVPKSKSAIAPGSRTKLGGKPQWIQSDETPICTKCQKGMTFVAQIDSISNENSDVGRALKKEISFMFADVGMIYVFWCSKCMATQAVLQSG